ncbi:uroporphyrinogen-III synthase [Novosphingobium sp.]|uniref:uroporphyrinogen-III synthase n=1 Tax=Novosphingobium sp. TaxID=1874826 RepID=UPI00333F40DB
MRPVLVLRPEPGNTATCRAAHALGLDALAAPLFAYAAAEWQIDATTRWDGVLVGSAAVFAHGGRGLDGLRAIPAHVVGPATARAARDAGFTVATTGSGGLQMVVAALPPGHYLRLAGAAHVPLQPPPGVTIHDVVVYAAQAQPLAPDMAALLQQGPALVLLHSAEAARHWCGQCDRHGLARNRIALACLAPRIAAAAGAGWQAIAIAENPDDQALLSLARQMCQTL